MTDTKNCDCGKPKPGPNGGKPRVSDSAPAGNRSLIASVGGARGGITHVSPDGTRTPAVDLIAARAAVARGGGSIEF